MASVTLSGWLDKRGGQDASKGWKRRWCILRNSTLRYYKSETDSSPAGTIYAEDIEEIHKDYEESQKESAKYGCVFRVVSKGRDYIFNAANSAQRDEWIKKINSLLHVYRSEEPQIPEVRYATVELFINRGIRVNGDVGSVLTAQLSSGTTKSHTDERGWFVDNVLPHATILNLFTQHGWSLATAFQSNTMPPGSSSGAPSDTLVFTHPTM